MLIQTVVTPEQEEKAIATLLLAFSTDPMARWSMPDSETYLRYFPQAIRGFAGNAFINGTVHYTPDFAGVGIWLAPGEESDGETLVNVMQKVMPETRFQEGGVLFEQMAAFHPEEPHWHLPLIGVDPAHQGEKLGRQLMEFALTECDRTAKQAYLESSNPDNIPFYEQFGFSVIGKVQSGSSPVMYPMLRKPVG